jgi:hypothetical protein
LKPRLLGHRCFKAVTLPYLLLIRSSEAISKFVIVSYRKQYGRQCYIVEAIVMVNCLNVKKYILSIVSEYFAVSISQEVSDTKLKSLDLSRLVSIPYIFFASLVISMFTPILVSPFTKSMHLFVVRPLLGCPS